MTFKELRQKSGMTQKEFSEYFGMSKRAVESWDGGTRKCPAYLLDLMKYKLESEGFFREKICYVRIPQKALEAERDPAKANERIKKLVSIQDKLAKKLADAEATAMTLEMKKHLDESK